MWNPDLEETQRFREQWLDVPATETIGNGFKAQWEQFICDVVAGRPHPHDLFSGARGMQLAEAALASSTQGVRIELAELTPVTTIRLPTQTAGFARALSRVSGRGAARRPGFNAEWPQRSR